MNALLEELQEIFRDVLDEPSLVLTPESNASKVEGWDSLAHVNLMTAVASHFKVKFKLSELQDLKNVGDLMALLSKKLEAQQAATK